MRWNCAAVAAICLSLVGTAGADASGWPHWRGPSQDGSSTETDLISSWSPDGQNLMWKADFIGRSTPVVIDGQVCVIGRRGEGIERQEVVACFDAESGEQRWEDRFNVYLTTVPFNRVGWASLAADPETGQIFAHGVAGQLIAYDRDGRILWQHFLPEQFGRLSGYGGRTQTPLVDGDLLIINFVSVGWGELKPLRHRYFAFDKRTGEPVWVSTPGAMAKDFNTQSSPVTAELGGRHVIVTGNADGAVYALDAATGEKVWGFNLSKRGLNSTVLVAGNRVFASHSEENIDVGTMGRMVAIDGTGTGDVTGTHELWRIDELSAGFPSPAYHDGRLYVIDNSANMYAIEAATGDVAWTHSVGTVGKGSPVWADGKLYVTETNGRVHILKPGPDGVESLDSDELEIESGAYAEIYGSVAIAYGRIYFTTEGGVYCLGSKDRPFKAPKSTLPAAAAGAGEPVTAQVVPWEVQLEPGQAATFQVRLLDSKGRRLAARPVEWSLQGLEGSIDAEGRFTAGGSDFQAGKIVAQVAGLTASGRARVFPPLPWAHDFEAYEDGQFPDHWIGANRIYLAGELDGRRVLVKRPRARGLNRTYLYMGPSWLDNYTIEAEVLGTQKGRRRPDIGLINSGYILDAKFGHGTLQIRSWTAELRVLEEVAFAWEPDTWYRIKLRVDNGKDKATLSGKVWKADDAEPEGWTLTTEDPLPIASGSPGLLAYSPVDVYYDNVKVTPNAAAAAAPRKAAASAGGDLVMFGGDASRNMVSDETGLPGEWDLQSGSNIKWVAKLGSQTYAGPIYYDGKIFVGTNNEELRNPKLPGDRGNVMAFDAETGEFLWQSAHAKLGAGRVNDWPLQGICSTPAVVDGKVYYMSNRAEVICADADGFRDGENDGPYTDETEISEIDEDVIWRYDLIGELDVFPHNLAAGSPLIVDDLLFAITGHGVDEGHINVPTPLGPSFVAMNRHTGELIWENSEPGTGILHGSWSNPSYAVLGGVPQVMFPGGDGWLYSFEPKTGKLIWKFDLNPKGSKWQLGGRGTRNNVISMAVIHDGLVYIAVGQDPEHGEGDGNLWAIDPAGKTGDITESGVVWHRGGEDFHRTMSSTSVQDGLVYIADLSGFVYCLDAKTGEEYWKYDTFAAIWGSTFVADGKVYIGDEDGDIAVLATGKSMKLLHETNMGAAVYTTPVAHDGVIYVASRTKLFAIEVSD